MDHSAGFLTIVLGSIRAENIVTVVVNLRRSQELEVFAFGNVALVLMSQLDELYSSGFTHTVHRYVKRVVNA